MDKTMHTLTKTGNKNMTANAMSQARYAAKMRSRSMKKLTIWATPEEAREIRSLLSKQKENQ